jgi:hypothetical protein
VLLVILFVAYYCGGYAAGRMGRFNGMKQGIAVWLWALVAGSLPPWPWPSPASPARPHRA